MKKKMLMLLGLISLNLEAESLQKVQTHQHNDDTTEVEFKTISIGSFTFEGFKARAQIGKSPNSSIYGKIKLDSGSDTLLKATSSISVDAQLHQNINDAGIMRMRETKNGFKISAEKPLIMEPTGFHIMLLNLKQPLKEDSTFKLNLFFASGREIKLIIPVVSLPKKHIH